MRSSHRVTIVVAVTVALASVVAVVGRADVPTPPLHNERRQASSTLAPA